MAPYQTNKPGISSLETASLDDASPQVNKGMEMMMLGLDRDSLVKTLGTEVGLRDWGYPGFLTELEFSIFVSCTVIMFTASWPSIRNTGDI